MAEDATVGGGRIAVTPPPSRTADRDRAGRIRESYGRWARIYDWFARATASVGGVRSSCVDALGLAPGDTVVEFGCGPGANLPVLREAVGPGGRVVGVDITGPMLRRARGLVARRGWENVSLARGDATWPPVAAADGVLATFVTSLFPDAYDVVGRWCDRADRVVVANFVPRGHRAANAALWGFARVNARLFDAAQGDVLAQLAARTDASRDALDARMDTVETTRHVFGTIEINAGLRES
ncbi:class I SAM-dependent methyltransferase [Halobellus salinus]|uniref:class I SAM-dependent methyltransferase n=1 Tax=Halobellus salinus TaxID=931585 RepID=UPI001662AA5F|nr:class I SAM-dependent methyltransferase [Halobellus salinus]